MSLLCGDLLILGESLGGHRATRHVSVLCSGGHDLHEIGLARFECCIISKEANDHVCVVKVEEDMAVSLVASLSIGKDSLLEVPIDVDRTTVDSYAGDFIVVIAARAEDNLTFAHFEEGVLGRTSRSRLEGSSA